MDNQLERKVERDFLSPADDIFLGIVIEIAVVKRRRIKRIEQLLQLAKLDLNCCYRARRFVHGCVGHCLLLSTFFPLADVNELLSLARPRSTAMTTLGADNPFLLSETALAQAINWRRKGVISRNFQEQPPPVS